MNNIKIVKTKIEHPEHTVSTIVPAKTEEVTEYFCEFPGCSFSTKSKQHAENHYGIEHTIKERRYIEGRTFLYFNSASDMALWRRAIRPDYNYVLANYTQPGWYMEEISQDHDDNKEITLTYIDDAIANAKESLKYVIRNAYKTKQFICEIEKMKEEPLK